jgi:hypothetical protein
LKSDFVKVLGFDVFGSDFFITNLKALHVRHFRTTLQTGSPEMVSLHLPWGFQLPWLELTCRKLNRRWVELVRLYSSEPHPDCRQEKVPVFVSS